MNNTVLNRISDILHEDVVDAQVQGGGCVAHSGVVTTSSGVRYFLKQGFSNGMFYNEANGLSEIKHSSTVRTPKLVGVDKDFLLLEYVEHGLKTKEAMYDFGCMLAQMHQYAGSAYGFYEDNYIGANRQINTLTQKWDDFYFNNRLKYQYQLAEQNGYATEALKSKFIKLEKVLHQVLDGSEELPSLLHGDLWSGNYIIDEQGQAVLIDPAVYYGHREADMAMTKLFGGFSKEFYAGYHNTYPLKEGFQFRENIYLLYHVLNHLNLFGKVYYSQALRLMDFYL